MDDESSLSVVFIESATTLSPTERLRFGRSARLTIDEDNLNLHRELGEFYFTSGQWWLRNIGRALPMRLWSSGGNSRSVLLSGSETPLHAEETFISFEAGRSRYEMSVVQAKAKPKFETTASDTITAADLPLTLSQQQLIVSLAETALRNPVAAMTVPSSKEAAARLNWSMTKFNAKLQNVCEKYSKIGVRGLGADNSSTTMDRRLRLVEHCVLNKVIVPTDLAVLDPDDR